MMKVVRLQTLEMFSHSVSCSAKSGYLVGRELHNFHYLSGTHVSVYYQSYLHYVDKSHFLLKCVPFVYISYMAFGPALGCVPVDHCTQITPRSPTTK